MKSIKNFFENIHVLHWTIVGAVICFTANVVAKILMGDYIPAVSIAIIVPCFITLGISYYRHSKNVMKGMLGAIIMWYVMDEINYVGNVYLPSVTSQGGAYNNAAGRVYIVFEVFVITLLVYLFINHFIINADHHSSPANVIQNQIVAMVVAICSIIEIFVTISSTGSAAANVLEIFSWQFSQIALVLSIVCIESKLDAYKIEREKKQ